MQFSRFLGNVRTNTKSVQCLTFYERAYLASKHTEVIDLKVAAVKSTRSTWPLQVKLSRFSSKSPPKLSTQVAAEF